MLLERQGVRAGVDDAPAALLIQGHRASRPNVHRRRADSNRPPRGWLVVLPFAVGLAGGADHREAVRSCTSETLIMVIPQRVPDSYVKSTVTAKMEDRLPSISNLILSRSRLERIIMDFNLSRTSARTGS